MQQTLQRQIIPFSLEALQKLSKDVKQTATNLGKAEARFLVDLYYQLQEFRIRTQSQCRSIIQSDVDEPINTLSFFQNNFAQLESDLQKVLDVYTMNHPVGRWCRSITGLGPVITAGFLANLDITKAPTAGHFWSYCGLNDQNRPWLGSVKVSDIVAGVLGNKKNKDITYADFAECCIRTQWRPENVINAIDGKGNKIFFNDNGEYKFKKEDIIKQLSKRPFNNNMKCLCWKLAQSFVKVQNSEKDFYGKLYVNRKLYETVKNENLEYKDQAEKSLKRLKDKSTETYKANIQGKLSQGHINRRAERYATMIFLSHLHQVMYMVEYGTLPPKPFAIEHLGHAHVIECPNLDVIMGG